MHIQGFCLNFFNLTSHYEVNIQYIALLSVMDKEKCHRPCLNWFPGSLVSRRYSCCHLAGFLVEKLRLDLQHEGSSDLALSPQFTNIFSCFSAANCFLNLPFVGRTHNISTKLNTRVPSCDLAGSLF